VPRSEASVAYRYDLDPEPTAGLAMVAVWSWSGTISTASSPPLPFHHPVRRFVAGNLVVGDSVAAITLIGDVDNNVQNCDETHACSRATSGIEFRYSAVLSGDDP
jgi:hypothetical protein